MKTFTDAAEIVEYRDRTWSKASRPLRLRAPLTTADQEAISRSFMGEFQSRASGEPSVFPSPITVVAHILSQMAVRDEWSRHHTTEDWKNWLMTLPGDAFNRLETFLNARYAAGHMPVRRTPQRPDKPPDWAPSDRLDALQFADAADD